MQNILHNIRTPISSLKLQPSITKEVKYDLEAYADCESTVILNQEQFDMLLLHLFLVMSFYCTKSKAYCCVMLPASHGLTVVFS